MITEPIIYLWYSRDYKSSMKTFLKMKISCEDLPEAEFSKHRLYCMKYQQRASTLKRLKHHFLESSFAWCPWGSSPELYQHAKWDPVQSGQTSSVKPASFTIQFTLPTLCDQRGLQQTETFRNYKVPQNVS